MTAAVSMLLCAAAVLLQQGGLVHAQTGGSPARPCDRAAEGGMYCGTRDGWTNRGTVSSSAECTQLCVNQGFDSCNAASYDASSRHCSNYQGCSATAADSRYATTWMACPQTGGSPARPCGGAAEGGMFCGTRDVWNNQGTVSSSAECTQLCVNQGFDSCNAASYQANTRHCSNYQGCSATAADGNVATTWMACPPLCNAYGSCSSPASQISNAAGTEGSDWATCCQCAGGGWQSNNVNACVDVDECDAGPCHNGACTNTAPAGTGTYSCSCSAGWQVKKFATVAG